MLYSGAHVIFYRFLKSSRRRVGAILLHKRTLDAPSDPAQWGLFGGGKEGQDRNNPRRTALREIREELKGIRRPRLTNFCNIRIRPKNGSPYLVTFFTASLPYDLDKLTLRYNKNERKVEGHGLAWFTSQELKSIPKRPQDQRAIRKFFRKFKKYRG